jgi:hypothetical protein
MVGRSNGTLPTRVQILVLAPFPGFIPGFSVVDLKKEVEKTEMVERDGRARNRTGTSSRSSTAEWGSSAWAHLGQGQLEGEIDEGDLSLRKNRGGRWAAPVVALRGKGEGGSKLGGAWCCGERGGLFIAAGRRFGRSEGCTRGARAPAMAVRPVCPWRNNCVVPTLLLDATRRAAALTGRS